MPGWRRSPAGGGEWEGQAPDRGDAPVRVAGPFESEAASAAGVGMACTAGPDDALEM